MASINLISHQFDSTMVSNRRSLTRKTRALPHPVYGLITQLLFMLQDTHQCMITHILFYFLLVTFGQESQEQHVTMQLWRYQLHLASASSASYMGHFQIDPSVVRVSGQALFSRGICLLPSTSGNGGQQHIQYT